MHHLYGNTDRASWSWVSDPGRLERGAIAEPSLRTLRALVRALDVTLDELAREDDPGSAKSRRGGHG
jgi:transcriptional regulator with XRE-family HTH domain